MSHDRSMVNVAHAWKPAHVVSSIFRLWFCGKLGELLLSCIFLDMPLTKVCVHCSASVNVRKAVCACGHVFDSKKSSPGKSP